MTLQFQVNNQTLSLSPAQKGMKIAADSKNYLKARFTFQTPEWTSNTIVFALFTHEGKTYKKILGAEPNTRYNECFVAPEVIKEGAFTVSLYCDDRITTTKETIEVEASGYTENIENEEHTPTVLEQMEQLMYNYTNLCVQIHNECEQILKEIKGE